MDRIAKLKEFLLAKPGDSFLEHALALEYIKLGDESTAKELFQDILLREPGYVGSYYHLGKLLERINSPQEAIDVYAKGMEVAHAIGDRHAYGELRGAWEELTIE